MKSLILLLVSIVAFSQGVNTVPGGVGKASNNLVFRGSGNTLPATCSVGQQFFKANATAGQNLYGCTSTNTWTVQGGSGTPGSTLLEQKTASASASLDLTSCITSAYDTYQIVLTNIVASVNGEHVGIQVSTNGGSSYVTTGTYLYATLYWNNSGSAMLQNSAASNIRLLQSTTTSALPKINAVIHLYNPLASVGYKSFSFTGTALTDTGTVAAGMTGFGHYKAETAINAFRIIPDSGTLTSGVVRCYGMAKQ